MTKKTIETTPARDAAPQEEKIRALLIEDGEIPAKADFREESGREAPGETVIDKGTLVEGTLTAAGHLSVLGTVRGNIAARGSVVVTGCVEGSVRGENVSLDGCAVRGDVFAQEELAIRSGAIVEGNLAARRAALNGRIRGDAVIAEAVVLQSGAFLLGGVTAGSITMQEGAFLAGDVHITERGEGLPDGEEFSRELAKRLRGEGETTAEPIVPSA